jgi:hypothetical protein
MKPIVRTAAWLSVFVAATLPARAAEITVSHAAIEKLLTSALLKDGGRLYLDGSPADTCRFAFVQEPKVSGGAGRLAIRFTFSGRAGARVAGRCVGPGDTLELTASGTPAYAGGELYLRDLRLDAPESAYFKAVAGLLQGQIERRLRLPVRTMVEQSLTAAANGSGVALGLQAFDVSSISVDEQGAKVALDASLSAR